MALVVEDGTGIEDAESYATVADADVYHVNHGNDDTWVAKTALEKERALRKATTYLDTKYGGRWKGRKTFVDQYLAWPREGVVDPDNIILDSETIPLEIKTATYELALRALSAELEPDQTRERYIKRERKAVGPLEKEIEYMDAAPAGTTYSLVEGLVKPFLRNDRTRNLLRA